MEPSSRYCRASKRKQYLIDSLISKQLISGQFLSPRRNSIQLVFFFTRWLFAYCKGGYIARQVERMVRFENSWLCGHSGCHQSHYEWAIQSAIRSPDHINAIALILPPANLSASCPRDCMHVYAPMGPNPLHASRVPPSENSGGK
jgi:hypothetical protein